MPTAFRDKTPVDAGWNPVARAAQPGGRAPHVKSWSRVGKPALRPVRKASPPWEGSQPVSTVIFCCSFVRCQVWELMASCMSLSASERLLRVSSSRGTDETKADKQLSNARATVGTQLVVSVA